MAADITAYNDALKQVWTKDRLESQLYNGNKTLDEFGKRPKYRTGKEAVTPLLTNRNGGYTVLGKDGGSLNTAGEAGIDQAVWTYTHHYLPIKVESSALDQTSSKDLAVAEALNTEVEVALDSLRKQLSRQVFGNGDALIAKCAATSAAAEVELDADDYGYDAIVRRWLHPGLYVDIGTTADEDAIADGIKITAVEKSSTTPSITLASGTYTTTTSHYVSVKDARSGTTSREMNGLRNIIATTGSLGGVDPATAGSEFWKAASVNSTSQALTLPLMLDAQEAVMQETGDVPDHVVTSIKQQRKFYELLQVQTRFANDTGLGAGNVGAVSFAGMPVHADPDCPNKNMFFLRKNNIFMVAVDKPYWQNKHTGGDILVWNPNTSAFIATLMYRVQLATDRRNAHAAITNLT